MGALEGKIVVVTGASRGLGEEMAVAFAKEETHIVVCARTQEDLDKVADRCRDAGALTVHAVASDIRDESRLESVLDAITMHGGPVDVFIGNAGTSYGMLTDKTFTDLTSYDKEIAKEIMEVNLLGLWLCMKQAFPKMREGGSFIAIGSETGKALRPGSGFYALSKASVDALVTMAAREQQGKLRVNSLSPGGMVDTKLFGPNGMSEDLKKHVPPLPADVIVPAALWLGGQESADITGTFVSGRMFNQEGPDYVRAQMATA